MMQLSVTLFVSVETFYFTVSILDFVVDSLISTDSDLSESLGR